MSRVRNESRHRESVVIAALTEAQLQEFVDAELDAQVLLRLTDSDMTVTHTNRGARILLGDQCVLPAIGALHWACRDVWAGGPPVNLHDLLWPGEHRWVDVRIRRLYGRLSVTLTDVTSRHEERIALLDSQCRYRLLAENAGDLVFSVRGRRVEWVSSSIRDLLGWEQSDVVGRRVIELVHPHDRDHVLQASCEEERTVTYEARFRRRGGEYVSLSVEMRPAQDLGGGIARVGSCRCID